MADQEIRAQVPAQVTYWEGEVKIEGMKNGAPVTGPGYAELRGTPGAWAGGFKKGGKGEEGKRRKGSGE